MTISYSVFGSVSAVAADFNGDGILDLAVASECPSFDGCPNGVVMILLGNGDGTFTTGNTYPTGGPHAGYLGIGDFNHDGKLDLVVSSQSSQGTNNSDITVLFGVGDGTFSIGATYSVGTSFEEGRVAVGDLNGDGNLDLVVTGNDSAVNVLLGNSDGSFQAAVAYPVIGTGVGAAAIGDLNKDGNMDVVVTSSSGGSAVVAVLLGNGDGTLQAAQTYATGGLSASYLAISDFNGDTIPDVAIVNTCGQNCNQAPGVGVLLGKGDGTLDSVQVTPSLGTDLGALFVGDLNGDGKTDIAVSQFCAHPTARNGCLSLPGMVIVLLGKGDGTFQAPQTYSSGGDGASDIVAGDFNGDGRVDLAIVNFQDSFGSLSNSEVGVLLNVNPLAAIRVSPASISFSPQIIGTLSTSDTVRLTNSGPVAINVAGFEAVGANSSDFAITNNCPVTLNVGANCTASVSFRPSATSAESVSITVSTTAPVEPHFIPITAAGGDFSLGPASGQPTSVTSTAGQNATLTLQVNPIGAFAGAVNLSCSGSIPQGSCNVSQASVTVSGTPPVPFAVTVTTTARPASGATLRFDPPSSNIISLLTGCIAFLAYVLLIGHRRKMWGTVVTTILLTVLIGCSSSSGGGGNPGTPAGTYSLTVTGTQQGVKRTLDLTLTVN